MRRYFQTNINRTLDEKPPEQFALSRPASERAVFTTFIGNITGNKLGVIGLDKHIQRVCNNATDSGVGSFKSQQIHNNLVKICSEIETTDYPLIFRIVISKEGVEYYIEQYTNPWLGLAGIRLKTARAERSEPQIKSCSFAVCKDAREAAINSGYHEALLVDRQKFIREGAWTNIFWSSGDSIYTTKDFVLPGITKELVEKIAINSDLKLEKTNISVDNFLKFVEEVFVTQSTSGITPVLSVDDHRFTPGKLTERIINSYNNQEPDYL